MRRLLPCPPCGRQGRPGQGTWQARIHEPRGSAPRERDHRGGDHPVPSRTRQLSPPSPRVLQRQAAGGQGVALAEGAFLHARERPRRPAGPAGGPDPPAGPCCVYAASKCSQVPFRARGGMLRAACSAFRGRLLLRAGPFRAWRVSYARNVYTFRVSSAHAALFRVLGRVSLE